MEHKKGLEKQEIKGKERSGDHVGKAPSEKSLAVESNEEQYRLTKKSIRKVKKSLENNEANLNVKSNSVICDSRIGSTLQETSLGDSMASDSEVEGISDGGSSVHYAFIGGQKAAKASIDAEEDMIDKDEFSDEAESIDLAPQGSDNENPTSDSEIEDFFIRDPVDKGKKEHKFKNETDLDEIKCSDDENSDDSDLDGNIEAVSRFQYLNENFKRIWGMGTEETIKHSLSRRGTGRGRGGFVSTKGPERFRGRYDDNPNLLPLGISQSSNKDQDNPNMVP
ncbi:hypothetical protein SK128_001280, partial [Halocaridina rubra]